MLSPESPATVFCFVYTLNYLVNFRNAFLRLVIVSLMFHSSSLFFVHTFFHLGVLALFSSLVFRLFQTLTRFLQGKLAPAQLRTRSGLGLGSSRIGLGLGTRTRRFTDRLEFWNRVRRSDAGAHGSDHGLGLVLIGLEIRFEKHGSKPGAIGLVSFRLGDSARLGLFRGFDRHLGLGIGLPFGSHLSSLSLALGLGQARAPPGRVVLDS